MTKPERSAPSDPHQPLVDSVRDGDTEAWQSMIDRFEGRLLAFAESRVRDRAASEDIVQETFVGFLTSLPNYDSGRPLESYLFSICAYKIADYLRREGRRPVLRMSGHGGDDESPWDPAGRDRVASSIARSGERRRLEEQAVIDAVRETIGRYKSRGDWTKLRCLEWLMVCGATNKDVASLTGLSEQQVANLKSDFYLRLKTIIARAGLDEAVFPELQDR